MNTRSLAIALASLVTALAGCTASSSSADNAGSNEDAFTATFASPSWKPIVSCDGGAMTIDVDTKERRQLRVVVHDLAIAKWISSGQYDSTYKSNACGTSPAENPCTRPDGTLELPGSTAEGVFSASQFSWLRGSAQLFSGERWVDFTAWRDGAGIRLEKMSDATSRWTCDYSGSGWCAPPERAPAPKVVYADWRFRTCQDL